MTAGMPKLGKGDGKSLGKSTPMMAKGGGSGSIGQGFKRTAKQGGPGPAATGKGGFPGVKKLSATAKTKSK